MSAARTIGGPGAGKTTRAMQIVDMILEKKICDPLHIGFVSFTRSARRTAAQRAADKFHVSVDSLEKEGYFRTLHSVAYRQLGVQKGELLGGTKSDNEWLKAILQDPQVSIGETDRDDDCFMFRSNFSESGKCLAMWDVARNRQMPLTSVWKYAAAVDDRCPDVELAQYLVTIYEAAKRKEGRIDFTDLLMQYAGRRWTGDHSHPFEEIDPAGAVPSIPVWMHDEAQDMSFLNALVFKRLIQPSQWVYLFGDQLQSVYSWAGADGNIFANWPVAKEEELPISYRCRQEILDFSYKIVRNNRAIPKKRLNFQSSKGMGGTLSRFPCVVHALQSLRADEDVLVLARTNGFAKAAADWLDELSIPWIPTKGAGGCNAPARVAGIVALERLRQGQAIDAEAYYRLLGLLPSKYKGDVFFASGTKSFYADKEERKDHCPLTLQNLGAAGATEACRNLIASGEYRELLDAPVRKLAHMAQRHGVEAIQKPKCRVGTCHSSKGMEADHVVAINRIPYPTARAIGESEDSLEEERRVWYVSASRAREKLTIAEDDGEPFPEL